MKLNNINNKLSCSFKKFINNSDIEVLWMLNDLPKFI